MTSHRAEFNREYRTLKSLDYKLRYQIMRVPDTDTLIPGTRDDPPAVVRDSDGVDRTLLRMWKKGWGNKEKKTYNMTWNFPYGFNLSCQCLWFFCVQGPNLFERGNIPILQGAILAPAHQPFPMRHKRNTIHNSRMPFQPLDQLACPHIPYPHYPITIPRCDIFPVWTKGRGFKFTPGFGISENLHRTTTHIPNTNGIVQCGGEKEHAIGREREAAHPFGVAFENISYKFSVGFPYLAFLRSAGRKIEAQGLPLCDSPLNLWQGICHQDWRTWLGSMCLLQRDPLVCCNP